MNQTPAPLADVGVIVGRFQVDDLHPGHRALIEDVMDRHKKVIVLLGVSPLTPSFNNPLDFESRKQMLMTAYPSLTVLYVRDVKDDVQWSIHVDRVIRDVLAPTQTAMLYGSRDSFIPAYKGGFDTYTLPAGKPFTFEISGSEIRKRLGREAKNSADWRAGVIWASRNRWPTAFQCVDVAIFNSDWSKLLLGRKQWENGWRLVGGFADPDSPSLEADAVREAKEETGVDVTNLQYVGSFLVDDWRYRNEPDCIKTALFFGKTVDEPVAADDIDEVRWFDVSELDPQFDHQVVKEHRAMVRKALLRARGMRMGRELILRD